MPSSPIPPPKPSSLSLAPDISNTASWRSLRRNPITGLVAVLFCRRKKAVNKSLAGEESSNIGHNNNNNKDKGYISPYYKGLLTNDSFKHQSFFDLRSKKSHAGSSSTTFTRFQGLGISCCDFAGKNRSDNNHDDQKKTAIAGLSDVVYKNNVTTTNTTTNKCSNSSSDSEKKPLRESLITALPQAVPGDSTDHDDQPNIVSPFEELVETIVIGDEAAPERDENVREFLWADKYRPRALEDFICNKDRAIQLQAMVRNEDCGHFIFHGPPGVGKRTMIWAMLREAFGPDSIQTREEFKVFNLKGDIVGKIAVLVKVSPRLVEVNLSELKGYEKHIIFELIKETSHMILHKSSLPCKPPDNCRGLIFYGVDKLSTDAILYIQWILERYKVCNKIFFCCEEVSKLQAIKNLCTVVHLLPPSRTEIIEVLKFIADKEGIQLPLQLAEKIVDISKSNLRQAIRSFEATWLKSYPFQEDQEVLTGWEDDIANIAMKMVYEQSPKQLYVMRGKLQNLVEHEVSPEFIFKSLVDELGKHLDDLLKRRVHNLYLEYNKKDESTFERDKTMGQTRRNEDIRQQFMRIEEFIAKFMSCYKAESAKNAHQADNDDQSES